MKETKDTEPIDPNKTYVIFGIHVRIPSKRWADAGVQAGDFVASASDIGDINTPAKIHAVLGASDGAELLIIRNGERKLIKL